MLHLAFIFHMHQPYYKNLLTNEAELPWVRLHGTKDYLDMVEILGEFPKIRQTFNLVPSLLEQIEDYVSGNIKEKYLELSYKNAAELSFEDKRFILQNFFSINKEKVISQHPRYYELYFKRASGKEFNEQDYLDLQVWFNLAWIDPELRRRSAELSQIVSKARFFTEEEKKVVLQKQMEILARIIPAYRKFMESGQAEVIVSPFYHPILPLLHNTRIAKEANPRTVLPKINFAYPEDAKCQVDMAAKFYKERFGVLPQGMWPSEESVSEHVLEYFMQAGLNWIVTDEGILFKSLRRKKRDTGLLYQPHMLEREQGRVNIIFRDRNLSDLLGFVYHTWKAKDAVSDFMRHLKNIAEAFKKQDILVTIAMDGENAWEYYNNDGRDFLELLYGRLSDVKYLKTTTVSDYLNSHETRFKIDRLAAGSWIYSEFGKWIGNPYKVLGWECLAVARRDLAECEGNIPREKLELAWKQMRIAEGSDWFWWYGEDPDGSFDRLFRTHLRNLYNLIGKSVPFYLEGPLDPAKLDQSAFYPTYSSS